MNKSDKPQQETVFHSLTPDTVITLVEKGRDGAIYYRRGNTVVEFTWEFSGVPTLDILIWEDTTSIQWIDVHSLECKPVSPRDRASIKQGWCEQ